MNASESWHGKREQTMIDIILEWSLVAMGIVLVLMGALLILGALGLFVSGVATLIAILL